MIRNILTFGILLMSAINVKAETKFSQYYDSKIEYFQKNNFAKIVGLEKDNLYNSVDTLETNAGRLFVSDYKYIIATKNSKTYVQKFLITNHKSKIFISKPIEIQNDSLFLWLTNNEDSLARGSIQPFVCKTKNYKEQEVYSPMNDFIPLLNSSTFLIRIYQTKEKEYSYWEINTISLLSQIDLTNATGKQRFVYNLNYETNQSLALAKLFLKLKLVIADIETKFEFYQ